MRHPDLGLPDDLTLRTAGTADMHAILELRREVGWAALDWALRLAIEPENARCVVVEDRSGAIVGVGSGVAYGPLGYVGNMIVAPSHRRRGVGSAVLRTVVAFLDAAGATRLELYATAEGRPLYERHGFVPMEPGSRVAFPRGLAPGIDGGGGVRVETPGRTALDELVAYDAPRFGGPRRDLLELVLSDPTRAGLVARRDGAVVGFAWLRADGGRIGPWVADSPEVAAAILREAWSRSAPETAELTANVPMSNRDAVAWLARIGVEPDPWDGRMARGEPVPRRDETIYGNAVGALG